MKEKIHSLPFVIEGAIIVIALVFACYALTNALNTTKQTYEEQVSCFGKLQYLDSTAVFINLNEQSCILFYIKKDTLFINHKNVDLFSFDKNTNIATIFFS